MRTDSNIRRENVPSSAFPVPSVRFALALVLSSISLLGVQQLRAQSDDSQQNNQDVGEAARQERARKQQQQEPNHVYTNEDLRRGKILTPKDQARAARRKQLAPPAVDPDAEPLNANSNTPKEPLGDVARRYRNAKKISPFHLPSQQSELAAPKILAPIPELKSGPALQPQPPSRNFASSKPSAPISRVPSSIAPLLPSARPHRIDPFVGRRVQPAPPSISIIRPAEPRIAAQPNFVPTSRPHTTSLASAQSVIVRQGDTLWTLSRRHLGRGTRWLELMAANPSVADPMRLAPGTALTLPPRIVTHRSTTSTVTIQSGDTLSKIALATYGHASAWPCIAKANPTLSNAHRLSIGQSLTLPASCKP